MNIEFNNYIKQIENKELSKLYDAFMIVKKEVVFYTYNSSEINFEREYSEQLYILDYFGIISYNRGSREVVLLSNPVEIIEYKNELELKMKEKGMFIF